MKNWIATEWFFSSVYFGSIVSISSIATIFNFHWYNDPALPSVSWNCEWKTGIGRIHSSPRFSPVELLFLLRDGVGVPQFSLTNSWMMTWKYVLTSVAHKYITALFSLVVTGTGDVWGEIRVASCCGNNCVPFYRII
jgi:hypothetical protein